MKKKITHIEAVERITKGEWEIALDYGIAKLSNEIGWTVAHIAAISYESYALQMSDKIARLKNKNGWTVAHEAARYHESYAKAHPEAFVN